MVIGEYTPPGDKPCCADCATPEQRRALRQQGAALVLRRRRRGGSGRGGSLRGEDLGEIRTPGNIKNLADQANSEIWAVARDYSKGIVSGAINHQQLASFKGFFNEWEGFYSSLDSWYSSIPFVGALTWNGTWNRIEDYRARANAWRNILISGGGSTSSPAPTPPKKEETPDAVKWIAGAAIVVGGAYAVGKLITLIPKPRSA